MIINVIIWLLVHISLLLGIGLIITVSKKLQQSQVRKAFLILIFLMSLLNTGTVLEMDFRIATGVTHMFFMNLCYIALCIMPVSILYFGKIILEPDWRPRLVHALFLVIPAVTLIMVFTNPLHKLFFINFSLYSSEAVYGPYYYFHSIYSYTCIMAGITLMFIASARYSGLFSMQSLLVILGVFVSLIPNMLYSFGIGNLPFSISTASFTFTVLFFAIAFLKYRFIESLPITLQQVVDLISDGYLVLDKQNNILTYNRTFLSFFPEPINITQGENLHAFFERHLLDIPYDRFLNLLSKAISEKGTATAEIRIFEEKYFVVELTPIIQHNIQIGSIILLKDVTQSKQLIESTKAASYAKSNFLAKMSHEIRTPMNAIIGMTELALRENDIYSKNTHIMTIKQAGSNLLSLLNDILDFSKIEKGKLEIIPAEYIFTSLINDVISIIRMRIIDTQLRFAVNIDRNIPNKLHGDVTRIRQVLLNILNNAVKYTEKGFVSLTINVKFTAENTINLIMEVMDSGRGIKPENIEKLFSDFMQFDMDKNKGIEGVGLGLSITHSIISAMNGNIDVKSQYGQGSVFTVTLPQKYLSRDGIASVKDPSGKRVLLYERRKLYTNSIIFTVDNLGVCCDLVSNDTELYEGLKKNIYSFLFISFSLFSKNKETIMAYGNDIKIVVLAEFGDVIPDKNLSVLAMPVYSTSVANILNGLSGNFSYSDSIEFTARFTAPDAKVLIVDDINTNLAVAHGLLMPYKIKVVLCKSGMEALEEVKSSRFDLIFMDQKMPEMDGVETTREIRKMGINDPFYKNIPIVALTANAISGTEELLLENGFNDFLTKPIDTIKLNKILENWIPKNKQKITTISGENEKLSASIKVEGLDTEKGLTYSGGEIKRYLDTLTVFHDDALIKLNEIRSCLDNDNLHLYTTHVHGLKSAAAMIGADELSEIAKSLEAAGERKDREYISMHNSGFLIKLELLVNNLKNVIITSIPESGPDSNNNADELKTKLTELKISLNKLDAGSMNRIIDNLLDTTQNTKIYPVIRKISDFILVSEFEKAEDLTDSLLLAKHEE